MSGSELLDPTVTQAHVMLLVPVCQSRPTVAGWQEGVAGFPVTNEQPSTVTDFAWRRRHVDLRAERALYQGRQVRTYAASVELTSREPDHERQLIMNTVEFVSTGALAPGSPGGVAVVHADVVPDRDPGGALCGVPLRWLSSQIKSLARPDYGLSPAIAPPLRTVGGFDVFSRREIVPATFATPVGSALQALKDPVPGTGWTALRFWAFALARGTPPTTKKLREGPLPETPGEAFDQPHRLAHVDRAGLAILGTRDQRELDKNYRDFVAPFRSIYADVLLLALLQQIQIIDLALALDELGDPVDDPRQFKGVTDRLRRVRNRYWWTSVTSWHWPDLVLRSYQQQNGLAPALSQLVEDVRDFDDAVERHYQRQLNLVVIVFAFIGAVGATATVLGAVPSVAGVFDVGAWGSRLAILVAVGVLFLLAPAAAFLFLRRRWRR